MGSVGGKWNDEEYSVIEDKGQLEFVDFQDDKSVCSYLPDEEGPIVISVPFPFLNGKPRSALVGERSVDAITIKNTTKEPVELWNVTIYASNPEKSFMLSLMEPPPANADEKTINAFVEFECLEDRVLQPLEVLTVWLSCKPKEIGLHQTAVQFDAGDDRLERVVFLLADDKVSHSLTSKKPYSRNTTKKQVNVQSYVAGSKPAGKVTNRSFKNRLHEYKIPKDVRELVESKQIPDVLNEELWKGNYSYYFKMLLILEEIQLEEDMRNYDMENVSMKRKGNQYLSLEVPGLAEKRPSLVQGDFILAKHASGDDGDASPAYQGYIHRVEADEVYLKFDKEFHFCHRDGNFYDVKFTYNRINMRRLYQAVEAAERLDTSFLFPSDSSRRRIRTVALRPISCTLNEEQIRSVEMILGCRGAPPYVIHGPPGTGKTMTLVEAILQLYKHRRNARILVCAPSNTAADNILEKLLNQKAVELKENSIFRLNAASRPYEDVRPDLIPFCFYDELIFKCPPLSALVSHRVIISTYMSASLLHAEGITRGHFTHIFMDEAGQASEPETMVPISNLSRRETVVVLAGDPLQLGPVVYSKEAQNYGYGKSYLERLFESKAYFDEDKNYVTKLVRNYRSHAQILHLPSNLFYNGELIACREDNKSINSLVEFIPNKEFPILFVGIQGCDEREGNNPSWFNRIEASKVVEIIKKLMTSDMNLSEEDIGVITPYRQQVLKLKKALENCDVPGIKVGSVEQFQGQERKVIIVSTVRSTVKHNNFDKSHCLGFLSNPRRFNVAVTRAIALLIIVGNPHIICQDTYWNKLLWHCLDNDSYQGCAPPSRVDNDLNNEESNQWSEKVDLWKDDGWGQESWNQNSWNEDPSNQNSWNKDPSNQNSWNEDTSNQNSWNEDPSNQNSWNEDTCNQNSWNEDPSNQNSWNEDPSNQNSWNEDPSNQNSWNEDPSNQNLWNEDPSNQNLWNEDPSNQASWNEDPSNQSLWNDEPSNKSSWNEDSSNQKSWNDDEPSNQKSWNDEEPSNQKSWNDGEPSNQKSWNDDEPSNNKSRTDEEPSNQKSWNADEPSNKKSLNEGSWSEAWDLEAKIPKSVAEEAEEWK